MGPDLELKGGLDISQVVSGNKETAGLMKELENNHMKCASNYEDNTFGMEVEMDEQTERGDRSPEEINIVGGINSGDIKSVEAEKQDQDLTESSSSFDSNVSGVENGSSLSDAEVDSELHADGFSALPFDGYSKFFRMRKKRLTPKWRKYIVPLMWRCKWVELQMKKFESQALKYDKEIAEYNRRKQLNNCISEDVNSKSLPFFTQNGKKAVMKRKKRKRVEDTVEIGSYMSRHNLFSYFENKRYAADAGFVDDNGGNQVACTEKTTNGNSELGVDEELLSFELKDGDNSLEQIFWKIGVIQSQVSEMKTRIHKVLTENSGRFPSADNLSLLVSCNTLTSSVQNPASPHNKEDRLLVGSSSFTTQVEPDCKMVDVVIPESAASSHGEINHVPETSVRSDEPGLGGSFKNSSSVGILIYNRRPKKDPNKSKEDGILSIEKPQVPQKEQESSITSSHALEPDLPTDDHSTLKLRSIAHLHTAVNNKRKRARRKAGSRKWNH